MRIRNTFNQARARYELVSAMLKQVYFKTTAPAQISGKIWHIPSGDHETCSTVQIVAVSTPDDRKKTATLFHIKELYFDQSYTGVIDFPMGLTFSMREAIFHIKEYDKRMAEKGFKPTMGTSHNLLPNNVQSFAVASGNNLKWPTEMALIGNIEARLSGTKIAHETRMFHLNEEQKKLMGLSF